MAGRLIATLIGGSVLTLTAIGLFLWHTLGGHSEITTLPRLSDSAIASLSDSADVSNFAKQFTPVELPMLVISDQLDYQSFEKALLPGHISDGSERTAGAILAAAGVDISNIPDEALNAIVESSVGIERQGDVATFMPYHNNDWFAVLLANRVFNDQARTRQLNLRLLTLRWSGELIDQTMLATQTELFDQSNEHVFEQYFNLRFESDGAIQKQHRTWRYLDRGGYGTAGWQDQQGWRISNDGRIQHANLRAIPRD